MLALELNDAGLILAQGVAHGVTQDGLTPEQILGESPGVASLEGDRVLTGTEAARRMRQRPLFAHSTFWRDLGLTALPRPTAGLATNADLAFVHLEEVFRPAAAVPAAERPLLVAVPPGYSREQLGILLGVLSERGETVVGLVDAGLAAASLEPAPRHVLHLDAELHRAVLTSLEHSGGDQGLRRTHFEVQLRIGLLAFQQTLLERIAEAFVRSTRFDPLHHAASEQLMVDRLPGWLEALQAADSVHAELDPGMPGVELGRAQLMEALQPRYTELVRLVQGARPAGETVDLRISHRLAALPGLLAHLSLLRDCSLRVLPRGAAALGALAHGESIRRPPESLSLVYRLPVDAADAGSADRPAFEPMTPEERPTHVLFGARAWAITGQPLRLGWAVPDGQRTLAVPAGAPGVSRVHCTLVSRDDVITIEDHSTYGCFVNDERVKGVSALRVGDRLRLGAPGVQLDLIRLVNG